MDRLQRDYLGATRKLKKHYKKGIGVLEEIRSGNINKEGLLKKELSKGDIGGTATLLFKAISFLD